MTHRQHMRCRLEMTMHSSQKIAQRFMAENDKAAMMSEQFDDMFDRL